MLQKLKQALMNSGMVQGTISLSKRLILPGFSRIPLYDVIKIMQQSIAKGHITTRASALAFKFFLALFPGILFLFSLIPYIPIEGFHEKMMMQLELIMPGDAFSTTQETINDILSQKRGGLLSLGFIFTLYLATNGTNAMMNALNESINITDKRSPIMQRLVALGLMLILITVVVLSIGGVIFSTVGVKYLVNEGYLIKGVHTWLIKLAEVAFFFCMFYFSISFIYFFAPAKRKKWRFFSIGSSVATVLMILVSVGFAWFVNNFGQYNKLYGSIGTLIVIMLWIYFNSLVLLLGFELNASIRRVKISRLEET